MPLIGTYVHFLLLSCTCRYSQLDLQDKFCVGTRDYNVYPPKFNFHPGFQANFSTESAHTDPISDTVGCSVKQAPVMNRTKVAKAPAEPCFAAKANSNDSVCRLCFLRSCALLHHKMPGWCAGHNRRRAKFEKAAA